MFLYLLRKIFWLGNTHRSVGNALIKEDHQQSQQTYASLVYGHHFMICQLTPDRRCHSFNTSWLCDASNTDITVYWWDMVVV